MISAKIPIYEGIAESLKMPLRRSVATTGNLFLHNAEAGLEVFRSSLTAFMSNFVKIGFSVLSSTSQDQTAIDVSFSTKIQNNLNLNIAVFLYKSTQLHFNSCLIS
jgi:hypothetical protein